MDPFVRQVADLCRVHVTRCKWVFVPSHAIGRTIGERIALEGTNWLNLRFVTPLDIALRMGAPFLVECGIDPSEDCRALNTQVTFVEDTWFAEACSSLPRY